MDILDTDHVGILQLAGGREYLALSQRIAKDQAAIVRGYRRMERILADFSNAQVLPFDEAAGEQFDDFRRQHIRIGTMDLRIAAIAHARSMTVLTRNTVDFERVPGLSVQDWTT